MLLTDSQLRAIQKLGEQAFKVSGTLYRKLAFAKDPLNPYGDSIVSYSTTPITFKGWLVPTGVSDFTTGVSQVIVSGNFKLRVPVTVEPEPGDKILIQGDEYYVSESSVEQTWPEWVTVNLRKIQG